VSGEGKEKWGGGQGNIFKIRRNEQDGWKGVLTTEGGGGELLGRQGNDRGNNTERGP